MPRPNFDSSREDLEMISTIANRAVSLAREFGVGYEKQEAMMDLLATNNTVPLKLSELAQADDSNFAHDVFGIRRHINRTTGELEDCFLPRFAV